MAGLTARPYSGCQQLQCVFFVDKAAFPKICWQSCLSITSNAYAQLLVKHLKYLRQQSRFSRNKNICTFTLGAIFVKSKHIQRLCESFFTFCQNFYRFCPDFMGFCPDFHQIEKFLACDCTPCNPPPTPVPAINPTSSGWIFFTSAQE